MLYGIISCTLSDHKCTSWSASAGEIDSRPVGQLLGFYYFLNQSSLQCNATKVEAEATVELLVHKTNMSLKPVYEDIDPVLLKQKGFHLVLQYPQQWCYRVMWLAQHDYLVILAVNTAGDVYVSLKGWNCCSFCKGHISIHLFIFCWCEGSYSNALYKAQPQTYLIDIKD